MIFEWMSDPSAWVGLVTLVVLEIVLQVLITWYLLLFWLKNCRHISEIPRVFWV